MGQVEFKKIGDKLVCDNHANNHSYEIEETAHGTNLLIVDGSPVFFFDNQEYAKKAANLIEEDSWN